MNTRPALSAARLCALGGGIQLVWGAILAVSLPARSIALAATGDAVRFYATISALGALVATIVQLVAGRLSDRERLVRGNRQRFYASGIALALPALLWFYLARDPLQLVAAFLVLQGVVNVAAGPFQAIIPDYIALAKRGAASSWMSAYQSLGNAAGLLVAGFVHDLRFVAVALALPLAGSCIVTSVHARELAADGNTSCGAPSVRLDLRGTLGTLLLSRGLINIGFFTLLGFLLFFVRDSLSIRGSAIETQTALVFLTFTLSAVAGAIAAATPTDRCDKRLVVTLAVGTIVVALAALALATSLWTAYAAAAFAGAAWGAFVTADWALATAVLPSAAMATAMGVWNVATTLPQVVAPLLTAPLVLRLGAVHPGSGPRAAIALSIVEFALGALVVWRLPRV